ASALGWPAPQMPQPFNGQFAHYGHPMPLTTLPEWRKFGQCQQGGRGFTRCHRHRPCARPRETPALSIPWPLLHAYRQKPPLERQPDRADLYFVPVFLRQHLGHEPFTGVNPKPRALNVLVVCFAYAVDVLNSITLAVISYLEDFLGKIIGLKLFRARV